MSPIEFRLNIEAVKPLLQHIQPMLDSLKVELAAPNKAPDGDEEMANIWQQDLLDSQKDDLSALAELFDDSFMDTGRTVLKMENADSLMRICAALRLKLRETTLSSLEDELLESGSLDFESLNETERLGYGAYMLFASLQEMIVSQLEYPEGDDLEEA